MAIYFLQLAGIEMKEFLLGSENWHFLVETTLRTLIMFLILLSGLRLLGKRGVKQLSVFELVVIIGLGSAAGDPMFYKDVGILPAIIVFSMVIILYKSITYFVGKSKKLEHLVEGKPVCLISEGRFSIHNFEKEPLAQDEFFSELRLAGVSHLGQVQLGIIETTGSLSLFFYEDEDVKFGLPILPDQFEEKQVTITESGYYSCSFCGTTEKLEPAAAHECPTCKKNKWIRSANNRRIR